MIEKNDVICVTSDDDFWNNWILDSTYSFYMCANKKLFDRYKPCETYTMKKQGHVVMANSSRSKVIGIGTVKIKGSMELS